MSVSLSVSNYPLMLCCAFGFIVITCVMYAMYCVFFVLFDGKKKNSLKSIVMY